MVTRHFKTILVLIFIVGIYFCKETDSQQVDVELSQLFSELWQLDSNRLELQGDIDIDLQGHLQRGSQGTDSASKPLFRYVNEAMLKSTPTYKHFITLLDNYYAQVGRPEVVTSDEALEQDAFLEAVLDTKVMQAAHKYLVSKRLVSPNREELKKVLKNLWFKLYKRSRDDDSSAFEHVFVGEQRRAQILGMHNWVQFYLEEKKGLVNYKGWFSKSCSPLPRLLTISFTWADTNEKSFGSLLIGPSPEFELAVYTVGFLVDNRSSKRVTIGPCQATLVCHRMGSDKMGTCYIQK